VRTIAAKVFLSELLLQLVQPFHPKLLPALCCKQRSHQMSKPARLKCEPMAHCHYHEANLIAIVFVVIIVF
jgi:hypothetical protein